MSEVRHDITKWITIEDSKWNTTEFCYYGTFGLIKVYDGYSDETGYYDNINIVKLSKSECEQILTNIESKE
jgi:hypothetical protein